MVFRLDPDKYGEFRAKIQFTTSARMPNDIYRACIATSTVSNTRYIQEAVCERLARDLEVPVEELLGALPTPRGPSGHLYDPSEATMSRYPRIEEDRSGGRSLIGPANTVEEVR